MGELRPRVGRLREQWPVPRLARLALGSVGVLAAAAAVAVAGPATGGTRTIDARVVRAGGINVEPSMRPWRYPGANPDGWWCRRRDCNGVANGTVFVDRELRLIARLGVSRLRIEFPWPLIEPRRNVFDWRRADYIVRRARRYRVRLLPVLVYTPAWDAADPNDPPPASSFAAFVRAVARRYGASIRAYELWNEPDLGRYWTGDPQEYVNDVLKPGYRAVKTANPRARVVLGGPASADLDWLSEIYRSGGGASFDVMSFHDYSADAQILEHARAVEDLLRAQGQPDKAIWLGEYGLQEAGRADVHQQALIRLVLTANAPIALASWYSLRDDHVMTCCPPATIKDENYGIMSARYAPKAGYATMRQLLVSKR